MIDVLNVCEDCIYCVERFYNASNYFRDGPGVYVRCNYTGVVRTLKGNDILKMGCVMSYE